MKLIRRQYQEGYHQAIFTREAPFSQRNQARLGLVLHYQPGGKLLEIGCGMGGFLRLAEKYFSVQGIDLSRSAIEAIRPHFGERVSLLNFEQSPLPGTGYDVIAVFNLFEHLRHPARAAERLYSALKTGGLMAGSVPNNFGLVGGINTCLLNFIDRTHISTFTPKTWRRIFHHAGFQDVRFFGEVTLGPNHCRYLTGQVWPYLAFNLMFVCLK